MDHLKGLLGRCMRARKRSAKCQYQYHDQWPSTSPTAQDNPVCQRHSPEVTELRPLPQEPKKLSKSSSIRIVETTESEDGSPPPEDTRDAPERRFSVSRRLYSDESTTVQGDDNSTSLDEERSPATTTSSTSTTTTTRTFNTDTHPRRIEDIPEEDEGEPPQPNAKDTTTTTNEEEKNEPLPTWRVNRRKSLVEILHLLQSSSSTIPKLSSIKLPLPSRSPLRKRASTTSLPSLTHSTSTSPSTTATPDDTDSDDEVKRQRRMGAIVFPAAMRLRGNDTGNGISSGGEIEGNGGRKRRPQTMIAGGGVSTTVTMTGKDKTLFC